MGHTCRICGRSRPNEQFSGHGHKIHVCKKCARMPKEERLAIEQSDMIFNFLKQSHISDRNLKTLEEMVQSENPRTAELAQIVLEVAKVKPFKKRRLRVLADTRPDLLDKLDETGLIRAHGWDCSKYDFLHPDWEDPPTDDGGDLQVEWDNILSMDPHDVPF